MSTLSIKASLAIPSRVMSEETPYTQPPHPGLPYEKEQILERVEHLEREIALSLDYPTDLTYQKRVRWQANRLATLLQTCGLPFAARLVFGIEQMAIRNLLFEDFWRSQLAEFVDAVHEIVKRESEKNTDTAS